MYVQFRGSKLADGRDRGANGSIIEGVHGLRVYQKFVADDAAVDALEAEALDIHGAEEFHIELYNEEAPPFEGFLVWLNRGIPGKSAYQVALVAGDVFVMNDAGKTIQKFVIPGKGSIQGLMSQEEKVIAETGSLHLIMENVATYFSDNLYDAEDGLRAREKLIELGIPEEIWEKRNLGYALPEWHDLKTVFGLGGNIEELISLGLLVQGEKKIYDRFRDRIICPLLNADGIVIAFRGLAIEGEPKLMDSPTHKLFNEYDLAPVDWDGPFYT